ncbi:hypothetical protein EMIT0P176_10427 [Pseudomonas sp. IT-P176]
MNNSPPMPRNTLVSGSCCWLSIICSSSLLTRSKASSASSGWPSICANNCRAGSRFCGALRLRNENQVRSWLMPMPQRAPRPSKISLVCARLLPWMPSFNRLNVAAARAGCCGSRALPAAKLTSTSNIGSSDVWINSTLVPVTVFQAWIFSARGTDGVAGDWASDCSFDPAGGDGEDGWAWADRQQQKIRLISGCT